MKLSIGIVGLPNVGKSTLFKALTKADILIANYPFATIDPNVGIVPVPDSRLDALHELSKSARKIPAVVEFYDIAGLVKGASAGEGLGNQFLTHIKETKVIAMVLRCFKSDEIIHVEHSVDPVRDMNVLLHELILKDLELVERRIEKAESEARAGTKEVKNKLETLLRIRGALNAGQLVRQTGIHFGGMSDLNLLTAKSQIYILNGTPEDISPDLTNKIEAIGAKWIVLDLSDPNTDLSPLIKAAYEILDLISLFTTGKDETRAWTITRGVKAPEAAGTIHSDFEKKFIRAEVVNWEKLVDADGWVEAKSKGLIRLEGKEYTVQDGDVIVVRHG